MIMKIFSVYDLKTQAYMQPFFSTTAGSAIRSFSDALADPNSMIAKHPEDFVLWLIGEFDDQMGKVEHITMVALGSATEFVTLGLNQEIVDESGHDNPYFNKEAAQ